MNYTIEFETDKKIANIVYTHHFRKLKHMKDDLIQSAIIRLWEFRTNNQSYYTISGAKKVAHRAMIDFFRTQEKHQNTISVFDEIAEGLAHIDILCDDDESAEVKLEKCTKLIDQISI